MTYHPEIAGAAAELQAWLDLRKEQGSKTHEIAEAVVEILAGLTEDVADLPPSPGLLAEEPDDLDAIRGLRPRGPRVMALDLDGAELEDRLLGAWLGRSAGCLLGIPCESMSREAVFASCKALGQKYPLRDYWRLDPKPPRSQERQYGLTPRKNMLKDGLKRVGADDDLAYTLLGLSILEDYGTDFTSADVGEAWLRYLPIACTAERVALENLRDGRVPPETALVNNPYAEWIGADIRSDPWGYAAPGCPERAAEFAHRDARVSHIRNGIYGEMYFGAVIAAAFAANDVEEALRIGLTEIPRKCRMAATVRETLRWCRRDADWLRTVERIERKYAGMSGVHTLNNAALTVAGMIYGGGGFEKTIALTVMAGMDTDCTGATAGSIVGALVGARRLPAKWTRPLGSSAETYLIGRRRFAHKSVARRFARIARRVRRRETGE